MKGLFTTICFLWLSTLSRAQGDSVFRLLRTIPVTAVDMAVDNLNNLYLLTPSDQLKKYNAQGDSVSVYNQTKRFGKLFSIDASNPLKLLLYYKDFSTIVILDRLLSIRSTIDLRQQNITQASAIGLSYDNNIWVFDALENKLKKVDEFGVTLSESIDFRTVFPQAFVPQRIIDYNGSVYLYDPAQGVAIFDYYGTLQKKLPIRGWQNLSVLDKQIIGTDNRHIYTYYTNNLMERQYQFPSSFGSFSRYLIANTQLFALSKDSVNIYSLRF
ncbi:MAG TPA: hypothetical protein VGE66_11230 [Chitinophagaceae bacterium]